MSVFFYNRFSYSFISICLCGVLIMVVGCNSKPTTAKDTLFRLLPSSETGITFTNNLTDREDMNIFNYHNFYNGGGVAIGDVNNDGKPDIFFTSNQGNNQLYLNKGNFKFDEVSVSAGLTSTHQWHTGVTMVDINADGWLDIYVSNAGIISNDDKSNELFINQQNGTFKEEAHAYGLDDKGLTTQAIFFDYDHDGDLDCFVLNNSAKSIGSFGYKSSLRLTRDEVNSDRLYQNVDGKFVDVSERAGIFGSEIAFGLGVTVGDVNNDGWEDLYVANDFFEKDYLYINQKDGTFIESINDAMGHTSNGSMGSDMADINNDGYLDIFTTEMLPESDYRLKTTIKFDDYDLQAARNKYDFHRQFTSNSLQLNNQDGRFSEIAQLAGVDATGWSWGALSFDFDNDGWKDIFVANGIYKDLTNQDFLEFISSEAARSQMRSEQSGFQGLLKKLPSDPIANYGFVNQHNLTFKNQTANLGFDTPGFSNGAAYGDLDGDGAVDLVVNNVNSAAFVYKNTSSETTHNHFLNIRLAGDNANTFGIGTSVTIYSQGQHQLLVQMPSRGFQSSVEPVLHFGLGNQSVDSMLVHWPNAKEQIIRQVPTDTTLTLYQNQAVQKRDNNVEKMDPQFVNVARQMITGNYKHTENDYVDFDAERLLPRMLSTEGPKLAVGDVNGDGLDDFYMGSASGDTAKLFIQRSNGHFYSIPQAAFIADKYIENTGAVFFDADGDGDQDLLVASAGNIAMQGSSNLYPKLYLNDGKGSFSRSLESLPQVSVNASCVRVGDFDKDGKPDIFVGGRNVPGSYGVQPPSFLLKNLGNGKFADVTKTTAPDLLHPGMVTDARWIDVDGDNQVELVIVGDWMPLTIYKMQRGKMSLFKSVPHSAGWWNCLLVADINADGKPDFIAGNFGLNSNIKADQNHPAKLYVSDFDKNGQIECIPVYYKSDGKPYPYFMKGELQSQIPQLKKTLLRFDEYAGKSIENIFTAQQLKEALVLKVEQTQSSMFINKGDGEFEMKSLPIMAQVSPVFGMTFTNLNDDAFNDLFLAGNFYGLKPQTGRFDASYGTALLANDSHQFNYENAKKFGLLIQGEARDIALIKCATGGEYIAVSMNNDNLYLFKKKK